MNKKLVYIFAVLVVGLFVVSACEQAVGRPAINRNLDGGADDPANITYYLNLTSSPWNSGYATLYETNGRQIGGVNPIPFPSNTRVILRAISQRNWTFSNWSGDLIGNNENVTITMNRNKNIVANFRRR